MLLLLLFFIVFFLSKFQREKLEEIVSSGLGEEGNMTFFLYFPL